MLNVEENYYDKYYRKIEEFDLLKMYHFTGARRKKYYMYKHVFLYDRQDKNMRYWCANHLNGKADEYFWLKGISDDKGIIKSCEIIQSRNFDKLEKKKLT